MNQIGKIVHVRLPIPAQASEDQGLQLVPSRRLLSAAFGWLIGAMSRIGFVAIAPCLVASPQAPERTV